MPMLRQIGKCPPHIFIWFGKLKFFFHFLLSSVRLRLFRRKISSSEKLKHSVLIGHSVMLAEKLYLASAAFVFVVEPFVSADRNAVVRTRTVGVDQLVIISCAFKTFSAALQKKNKIDLGSPKFILFRKWDIGIYRRTPSDFSLSG